MNTSLRSPGVSGTAVGILTDAPAGRKARFDLPPNRRQTSCAGVADSAVLL